ncbi:MAG: SpaA isopeptide-forming pilin-related protein [Bacillota bacterium]
MLRKTTALLLLIVLLFTNNVIAVQSAFDYTLQPSTGNAPGSSNFDSNVNNAVGAGNSLANAYISEAKENLNIDWLRRLELSLSYNNTLNTWLYGASMIQPFAWSFDPTASDMLFFQLNAQKDSTNFYGNAGIGYRTLFSDRKSLVGLNAFFDEDFQNQNQRIGAGIEYFNRLAEVRANGYYGYSKPKFLSEDDNYWYYQQVTNGFDFGVSLNVPSAEWLKLNATGYTNMYQYVPATTGAVFDIQAQVLPQLRLEYGYNISSGTTSSTSQFFKFNFNLGGVIGPVLFGADNETKAIVDKDLSYKLLQPVQRNNLIVTEDYKTAKTGGNASITVTYSNGDPVGAGQLVTMIPYAGSPIAAVGASNLTAITNNNSIATFTNIMAGTYTASVTINGVTYSQRAIAIINGQTTTPPPIVGPPNPVKTGMTATVKYTDGTNVADGTVVTATSTVAGGPVYSGTTVAGIATITGMNVGSYVVKATLAGIDYSVANPVTLVANVVTAVAIATGNNPATGQLNVTVTYTDSTAVSGAVVTANNGQTTKQATTNGNGLASFVGLSAGTYSTSVTINSVPYSGAPTVVAVGQTAEVAITGPNNPSYGYANITVAYSNGDPVGAGQTVTMTAGANHPTAVTNGSSVAAFTQLLAGTYTASVTISGGTYSQLNIGVTVGNTAVATIAGPANPLKTGITATVKYTDGTNVPDGTVVTATGSTVYTGTTVAGVATITGMSVGNYVVKANIGGADYAANENPIAVAANAISSATINSANNPAYGWITATVKYSDLTPVAGTTVSATLLTSGKIYSGTTGSNGVAQILNMAPGMYNVSAVVGGIVANASENPLEVIENHNVTATIIGTSNPNKGTVSTTVKYTDGTAVNGAAVTITPVGSGTTYTGTTNSNGTAQVSNMLLGQYNVNATIAGIIYNATENPVTVSGGVVAMATITGPANPAKTGITATVKYSDGTSVQDGTLVTATGNTTYSQRTVAGIATFTGMTVGNYVVKATFDYVDYNANENPVAVVANAMATATINSINNPDKGWITATVKFTDQTPVNGTIVSATPVVGGTAFTGTTNGSGIARILNITAGASYIVSAVVGGNVCYASENPVAVTANHNSTATITGSSNPLKGTVSATFKYTDGTAINGAAVTITPVGSGTTYTGTTDSNGTAQVNNMLLGQYNIKAMLAGTDYQATGNPITVNGGVVTLATITGPANPTKTGITATVKYTDGTNVPDGTLVTATGTKVYTGTTTSGTVTILSMDPGSYVVKANINSADYNANENPVTVVANAIATATINSANNPSKGWITATVKYTDTTPVNGVIVTATPVAGGAAFIATTGSNGVAQILNIVPGAYNVSATISSSPCNASQNPVLVVANQNAVATITGPNNPLKGTVSATVKYSDGNAVSGVTVTMTPVGAGTTYTGTTNSNGVVQQDNMLLGQYNVKATIAGTDYNATENPVTVSGGNVSTATITGPANPLKTGITATVKYTDGTNVPEGTVVTATGSATYTGTTVAGVATITGMNVGSYVVKATTSGVDYPATGNPITVAANVITAVAIATGNNPETGQLNVTVTYTDNTAVSGVVVTANNGATSKQATTNGSGVASFVGLSAATYSTSVTINGTPYSGVPTVVAVGQTATVAITGPNNPGYGYANITVAYSNGDPVGAGQIVTMTSGVNHPTAVTNGSSVATFNQLLAGTYTATVTINSVVYNQANVAVTVGQTAAATITGPANPTKTGITATVKYTDGTNVPDGTLVTATGTKVYTGTTTSGTVTILSMDPGSYVVKANINSADYNANENPVTVVANAIATATINSANNPANGWITATVKYTDQTPVNGTIVSATPVAGGTAFTGTTNSSGVAQIMNVTPGASYNVSAVVGGNVCNATENPIAVTANHNSTATITGQNNPLKGTVSATFKYTDGTAINGASVTITPVGSGTTYNGTTNSNGTAQVSNMLLGQYTVKATIAGTDYNATENPVTVSGGVVTTATITGPANPLKTGITATVKYTDGTNVPDGTVVTATGSATYTGTTVAGVATITGMNVGSYVVKATISGVDYPATGNPITVVANASTAVAITGPTNPLKGDLAITLKYDNGVLIPNQPITITQGLTTFNVTTNASGIGYFYGVNPGSYTVSTVISGQTYTMEVTAVSGTVINTNFVIPLPSGKVSITARYADGITKMYGWEVKAVSKTNSSNYRIGVTDVNGYFEFSTLTSGEWYVYIRKDVADPFPPTPEADYLSNPSPVLIQIGVPQSATITGPAKPAPPSDGSIRSLLIYTDASKTTQIANGSTVNLFPPTGDPLTTTYQSGGVAFLNIPLVTYTLGAYISGTLKNVITSPPLALSEATPEISNATGYVEPNPGSINVTIDFGVNTALAGKVTATWGATVVERATQSGAATFTDCLPPNTAGTQYTFAFVPTATVYGDNLVSMTRTISTGTNPAWRPSAYYKPSVLVGVHEALNPSNMVSDAIISISSNASSGWVVCGTTSAGGLITPIKVWYNGNQTTKYYFKAEKAGKTVVSSAMSFNDIDPTGTVFIDW